MDLPNQFLLNMQTLLGDQYNEYIKSFKQQRTFGIRANTLKTSAKQLKSLLDSYADTDISWCADGFYHHEDFKPAKHPYYSAGLYYIQEPSAMAPSSVINIDHGDRVLDLCAAPGGKSTHLAAKLNGSGILVSKDISTGRCKALQRNIELCGATNVIITNESPQNLKKIFAGYFNKILIDAPCSGEGMFRKDSGLIKDWNPNSNEEYSQMQKTILKEAAELLDLGGEILYSTCTFSKIENENVIEEFLKSNPDFSLVPIDCKKYGFSHGYLDGTVRLFPHKQKGEGHFLALIKRKWQNLLANKTFGDNHKNIPHEFYEFADKYISKKLCGNLQLYKDSVFLVPHIMPSLKGLRIFRGGFYLGDVKTKRFEPSHALALSLNISDFSNTISFDAEDQRLKRYLKGESFDVDVPDGWLLVCVDNYSIGFAKVVAGRLKNKFPCCWMIC